MKAKKYFYAVSIVFLLSACDKNGSGVNVKTGGYDPKTISQQNQQQSQGLPGSDNQQVNDVTTTAEYQKYIAPLGQKIMSFNEFSLPDESTPTSDKPSRMTDFFLLIAKMKKWQLTNNMTGTGGRSSGGGRIGLVPDGSGNNNTNANFAVMKGNQQSSKANQQQQPTQALQIRPDLNLLYRDASNYFKITTDTIYLNQQYYQSQQEEGRAALILKAIIAQMFLNQHLKATDLLNQMANSDSQMRSEQAISRAAKADQSESLNPIFSTTTLSDVEVAGIQSFDKYLQGYMDNPTPLSADDLFSSVKTYFARGANFARPYDDIRAGAKPTDSSSSSTTTTTTSTSTTSTTQPDKPDGSSDQ